jgi:2-oxo-hept-3-ene-1,7-dioate hydratase/2-keto-4-pentenoate hydratase
MLDEATRIKIADAIERVYVDRSPLPLLTKTYPGIEVADAYRIQEIFVGRRLAAGTQLKGYKVGLTSKVMQELAGSTEPDFSALTNDLFVSEDTDLDATRYFNPLAEIEIAFVLKDRLSGPGIVPLDVIRATDFILPAIEIVDFRVAQTPGMTITDTVADLAGCGGIILGSTPRRLEQLDICNVSGSVLRDGKVFVQGKASAVLGSPVNSVAWLANKLSEFGISFEPGQVIMTGSFVRAFPIKAGDEIRCVFSQGLGTVVTRFV